MPRKGKSEVLIDIKGDSKDLDDAVKKSNKSLKSIGDSALSAAANMAKLGLAVTGIGAAYSAFAVKVALPFEGVNRAFNTLVSNQGENADVFIDKLKEMSKNTISELDLMTKANMALTLGLSTSTLVTFMEAASTIAQATGADVSDMFDSLTTGTARQSRELLDNLGIMISVEAANKKYADSISKNVNELTTEETRIAFVNFALEASEEKLKSLGGFVLDTKVKWEQLGAAFKDTTVSIGQKLIPELDKVLDWTLANKDWFISTFAEIFTIDVENIGDAVVKNLEKIKKWVDSHPELLTRMWEEPVKLAIALYDTSVLIKKELQGFQALLDENIEIVSPSEKAEGEAFASKFIMPAHGVTPSGPSPWKKGESLRGDVSRALTILKLDSNATNALLSGKTVSVTANAATSGT